VNKFGTHPKTIVYFPTNNFWLDWVGAYITPLGTANS